MSKKKSRKVKKRMAILWFYISCLFCESYPGGPRGEAVFLSLDATTDMVEARKERNRIYLALTKIQVRIK